VTPQGEKQQNKPKVNGKQVGCLHLIIHEHMHRRTENPSTAWAEEKK